LEDVQLQFSPETMPESQEPIELAKDETSQSGDSEAVRDTSQRNPKEKRGWRFWALFSALWTTALLSALEGTVVSTALPTIVHDLGVGENYVWIVNAYYLTL
jgi:hypothetical protein